MASRRGPGLCAASCAPLSGSQAPGALRACNSSLQPVCSLYSRPSREQNWGGGEGAAAWSGKGWSQVPGAAGESFSSGAFSGEPVIGALAGGASTAHPQILNPAPACCWERQLS